ncbi:hypothetical protein EIL87_05215 [Saccharopolyspora rhizosphaerae]|uniref:DUF3039 domain-containing protein n=1 Tax=Saccharopolyspora rhizosphaerae TaxID=2492662 RepID=A0A3R8R5J8_9PSEU|nr:hypothetical protein [Saccharopolyspora rhizosphaerae]RRO18910.1 hypothetical protein EIL87_05215 [Saccharopolyspora rhizosphaerae]
MSAVVAVRFAAGVVAESRRQTHLASRPEGPFPAAWRTLCGLQIPSYAAQVSEQPTGMPCVRCMSRLPAPAEPELEQ